MKSQPLYIRWIVLCSAIILLSSLSKTQDDGDPKWSVSFGSRFLSRYTSYGVDLAGDQSAFSHSASLSHISGASAGIRAIQTLGTDAGLQSWSFDAGYDYELSDYLTLSAAYSYTSYKNDSVNVLAALSHSISLEAEFSFSLFSASLSYDTFLGGDGANYFSADVSTFLDFDRLLIVPLVQATFVSQEIDDVLLSKVKSTSGKKSTGSNAVTSVTTITGLSSVSAHAVLSYRLLPGLRFSLHPMVLYSPKSELASSDIQFLWAAGIRYTKDF